MDDAEQGYPLQNQLVEGNSVNSLVLGLHILKLNYDPKKGLFYMMKWVNREKFESTLFLEKWDSSKEMTWLAKAQGKSMHGDNGKENPLLIPNTL